MSSATATIASRSTIVKGDADAAMAGADVVVKERYVADMSHAVPIEPHAIWREWQGDQVTIWSSTQVPFVARGRRRARRSQMPENHVRVDRAAPRRRLRRQVRASTTRRTSPRWPAPPAARCGSCSRAREEFLAPDHRREGMVDRDRDRRHAATARSSPAAAG